MLNQFNKGTGVSLWSAAFCVALLWGCGGSSEPSESGGPDDSADIDDTERDDGDETSSTNTESDAEVDDSTDAVEDDTDDTTDSTTDESANTDTGDTMSCDDTLVITFDLSGSRFRVDPKSGLAQTAEEEIGPGSVTMRFVAGSNVAQEGRVTVLEYSNTVAFSISDVDTAMDTFSGPDACGVAIGSLESTTLNWASPMADYTSEGTVTCNAGAVICGIIGMEEGVAEERYTVQDLDLGSFVFDSDLEGFEMDWVQVTDDNDATTFLKLTGTRSTKSDEQPVCEVAPDCP